MEGNQLADKPNLVVEGNGPKSEGISNALEDSVADIKTQILDPIIPSEILGPNRTLLVMTQLSKLDELFLQREDGFGCIEHSIHGGSYQPHDIMGRLIGVLGGLGIFNFFESLFFLKRM